MTRTFSPKPADVQREWLVIDATDVVLGRLASHAAALLRGKHKPTFAPHMDMGDHVIIVNADKVVLTGSKLTQKVAYRHSGYPGGLTGVTYDKFMETIRFARWRKLSAACSPRTPWVATRWPSSRSTPVASTLTRRRCPSPTLSTRSRSSAEAKDT